MLTELLTQLGLEIDNAVLATKLENVDVSGGDTDGILGAVGAYLKDSAGMVDDQVEQVLEQGKVVLVQMLPQLGIKARTSPETEVEGEGEVHMNGDAQQPLRGQSEVVIIEDVKAFKASMPLSAGARPVKELVEFEELEPKL